MTQLNPYLGFDGKCREAMTFYKNILGGELTMQTMGESPMAAQMPPEAKNNILHSALITKNFTIMGSDMAGLDGVKRGNDVSLCLVCESKEEINTLYAKLSDGGKADHPLKEEFFGTFGDLTDKYGFRWMLQFGSGPQK